MKKNNLKMATALALAGVLAVAPMTAEAATYKDVGPNHWAYSYISNLSDLNIVRGYTDGSFKPQRSVTYLEILQLLKGIQNPTAQEVTAAIVNNGHIADMYKVPSWARSAVCVALENGVIDETNLKAAYNRGYITGTVEEEQYPTRETILIYYAKALGVTPKADTSNIKVNDIDLIGKTPKDLIGDVDVKGIYAAMIDTKIFHEMGSDGNFNPQKPLKREQMAKITDLSYDYKNNVKQTEEYEGEIYLSETVNGVPTVAIKDKDGKPIAFVLSGDTKITINGKAAEQKDLTEGSKVKVTAYSDTTGVTSLHAVSIDVTAQDLEGTGIVKSIDDKEITIDYTTEKDATVDASSKLEKKLTLKLDKNINFYMFGKKVNAEDISPYDMVTFTSKNDVIKEVHVFPQKGTFTTEFLNYNYGSRFGDKETIELKFQDGSTYTFTIDKKELSDKLRSLVGELDKGNKLTIETNYQNLVNAKEVEENVQGYLESITSDIEGYKMTIHTPSGKQTYLLNDSITYKTYKGVEKESIKSQTLYNEFQLNIPQKYYINLHLKGNRVNIVEWIGELKEPNYKVKITNVRPGSTDSWWNNKEDSSGKYVRFIYDVDENSSKLENFPAEFFVKESFEKEILKNSRKPMILTIDIYEDEKGYHYANPKISGEYGLKDLSISLGSVHGYR
ncbi:MAG: S-layer homology domain-containing protein [Peptoniphilus sp.]|nr:S-layer homology domain-containing protein [Peptoniphilus sp.]MDD7363105.1 S-layer homology domain-containing protein [Bacillota bacterium]MDY6044373.1 S-layer homology domain-containing protein [Peptoniphilus sp.]